LQIDTEKTSRNYFQLRANSPTSQKNLASIQHRFDILKIARSAKSYVINLSKRRIRCLTLKNTSEIDDIYSKSIRFISFINTQIFTKLL